MVDDWTATTVILSTNIDPVVFLILSRSMGQYLCQRAVTSMEEFIRVPTWEIVQHWLILFRVITSSLVGCYNVAAGQYPVPRVNMP